MAELFLTKNKLILKITSFLEEIGIAVYQEAITEPTFLPGLKIDKGCLFYDPEKLLYPGDLVHEAGHIAICDPQNRNTLDEVFIANNPQKEGEEIAALIWSYFAVVEMKLPPEIVFHKDGYKGDSKWILSNFRNRNFIGFPLLKWYGIADYQDNKPKILRWLR